MGILPRLSLLIISPLPLILRRVVRVPICVASTIVVTPPAAVQNVVNRLILLDGLSKLVPGRLLFVEDDFFNFEVHQLPCSRRYPDMRGPRHVTALGKNKPVIFAMCPVWSDWPYLPVEVPLDCVVESGPFNRRVNPTNHELKPRRLIKGE